jgi:hypothetical protein
MPRSDVMYRQRAKVLNYARELARSGVHTDHKSIMVEVTARDDFAVARKWLENSAFRAQLDKLCAQARRAAEGRHMNLLDAVRKRQSNGRD